MNYDAKKYDPNTAFEPIPAGKHRLRIETAEETKSKNGNDMIKVTFAVSGHRGRLFHYFVDGEFLQQYIDPFFDSFGISPGDFNVLNWRGKAGAAQVKHEMYKDSPQARISYFILHSRQAELPQWEEGASAGADVGSLRDEPDFPFGANVAGGNDLPF
jgi:hypothetical protein